MEKRETALDDVAMRCEAMTSPALNEQFYTKIPSRSGFNYPLHWHGKVPLKVVLMKNVYSDLPISPDGTVAENRKTYYAWVNQHGAVSAILPNGEKLGLMPDEFEIIEWHPLFQK